ncbi:MAG: hypothetical protein A2V88_12460 [Elusimicrobia bacterium RBG_16_66_12]|nr:MAG: hypothetical protein A2V88_12460 [Elusimicrobia bacterium RBG_16_66_12]
MRPSRTLFSALLIAALASLARAQAPAVDFDGAARGASGALVLPPRPERRAQAPAAAAPAQTVTFGGAVLPLRAFSRTDRIPDSLVSAIDATRSRLLLALYELNLPGVADAIVRAKSRGVDVRLVFDKGHATPGAGDAGPASGPSPEFQRVVAAGVETRLLKGGGSWGIMHNKFAVFDGTLLETGSFNWTRAADRSNFENAIFRSDPSLAALYSSYWEWMWGLAQPADPSIAADPVGAGFGTPPSDPSPSVPFKDKTWPRVAFSPEGGVEARLLEAISACGRSVDVAIFSFYSQAVADALIAAKARGVAVRAVSDVSQSRRSPAIQSLVAAGVTLKLSAGRGGAGVLHHKMMIYDGEMLAAGSFNFSRNAEKFNFESQFFTADGGDLAAYQEEFEAVWAQAHDPAPGELPGPK